LHIFLLPYITSDAFHHVSEIGSCHTGCAGNADSQCNKFLYSGTHYKGQPVYQVTLVCFQLHKFTCPPCCYC